MSTPLISQVRIFKFSRKKRASNFFETAFNQPKPKPNLEYFYVLFYPFNISTGAGINLNLIALIYKHGNFNFYSCTNRSTL